MWINASYLLLTLAVFFNCSGSMDPQPQTLKDLFPGFNGIMPPTEKLVYRGQIENFGTCNGKPLKYEAPLLLKRDHIIFGWIHRGDYINYPYELFLHLPFGFIAFDMNRGQWFNLTSDLSRKLGTRRRYSQIFARDQVAATHVTTSTNPIYKEAHIRACKQANDRADRVEEEQDYLLFDCQITMERSAEVMKEEYSRAYNRAFMLHLHPFGEYHIQGHRGRRP